VRLDRDVPYPDGQVRSVTLGYAGGRLYVDVTAEVPVATYPEELAPDPARVAGVDLGVIHPFAVAGPDGNGLLVSGRAIRAEHRQHLRDQKARRTRSRPGPESRTAEPDGTCPVSTRHDVTRDATSPHHGPRRQGTWPAPAHPAHHQAHGESLAAMRGIRKHTRAPPRRTYG
jgi:hypothetical protein